MPHLLCYLLDNLDLHIGLYKKDGATVFLEFSQKIALEDEKKAFPLLQKILQERPDQEKIVVGSFVENKDIIFSSIELGPVPFFSLPKLIPLQFEQSLPFRYEEGLYLTKVSKKNRKTRIDLQGSLKKNIALKLESLEENGIKNIWLGSEIDVLFTLLQKENPDLNSALILRKGGKYLSAVVVKDRHIDAALTIEHHGDISGAVIRFLGWFKKHYEEGITHILQIGELPQDLLGDFTLIKTNFSLLEAIAHSFFSENSSYQDFGSKAKTFPWRLHKRAKAIGSLVFASSFLLLATFVSSHLCLQRAQKKIQQELSYYLPETGQSETSDTSGKISSLLVKKRKQEAFEKKYAPLFPLLQTLSQVEELRITNINFSLHPKPSLVVEAQPSPGKPLQLPFEPKYMSQNEKKLVFHYE